jgi:hypothetical protein
MTRRHDCRLAAGDQRRDVHLPTAQPRGNIPVLAELVRSLHLFLDLHARAHTHTTTSTPVTRQLHASAPQIAAGRRR